MLSGGADAFYAFSLSLMTGNSSSVKLTKKSTPSKADEEVVAPDETVPSEVPPPPEKPRIGRHIHVTATESLGSQDKG
jgi:hypothetical protein